MSTAAEISNYLTLATMQARPAAEGLGLAPRLGGAGGSGFCGRGDVDDSRGGEDDVSVGDVREDSLPGSLSTRC